MSVSAEQMRVAPGGEIVCLSGEELDRLLLALAALDGRDAAAVGEQIVALRLAGGTIDLMPTEAERAALRLAVAAAGEGGEEVGGALADLVAICADGGSVSGAAVA